MPLWWLAGGKRSFDRRIRKKEKKKRHKKKKKFRRGARPRPWCYCFSSIFYVLKISRLSTVHVRIAMSRNQARRWRCSIGEAVSPPDYITAPTRCKYFAAERQNSWQRFVSYEYACNATTSRLSIHFIEMQARRKPVMHMRSKVQYR